jgi:hypothetical protein
MSRLISVGVVVAAVVALATAGCGNAGASGPGAANGAASVVPADAVAFVTASTDLTSSQWHAVTGILLKKAEAQANLSWANDVRPALGSEVDVAVLPGRQVVAFAQPDDNAKLDALATKYKVQTRTSGGWTAVAKTTSALDDVANATSHLADSNVFVDAMGRLPADALVRAYASGSGTTMGDVRHDRGARRAPHGHHRARALSRRAGCRRTPDRGRVGRRRPDLRGGRP